MVSLGPRLRAIGPVVGALYLIHTAVFGWYIADDAGISLAYARNLAHGYGPVLYPGAPAVEGFSNPLWVALLALGSVVRLDGGHGIPLMKILGVALGALTLGLTWRLGRQAYPSDAGGGWLAPCVLALWTPFVFWTGAGLENALYACLLVLAASLQLRELDDARRRPWSAVALLGVALTRPEGIAFFLAFLVHRLVARGRAAVWTSIVIAGYAGFLALRHFVFDAWVPNTYYAKVTDRHLSALLTYALDRDDSGRVYLVSFARAWWPVLLAACVGLADLGRWRPNLLFTAILGGTGAYALYAGGDFWPVGRFFSSVLPFAALAAQHGIAVTAGRVKHGTAAAAAVLIALVTVSSVSASMDLRRRHHEDTLISLQGRVAQGLLVRELATSLGIEDPLYLDPDIGGPTLVGLRVLDLGGLTDIHIARFQYYAPFFRQYIFEEQRPHFIRTHASWTRSSRITAFPEFVEQYRPIKQYRDARGLHGLFVRQDLASGAPPADAASFGHARALTRAVHQRETQREREGWIEYYGFTRDYDRLVQIFREEESAGTLTTDPRRSEELYFGLLAAGEREGARRVAARARLQRPAPITLYAGAEPVLSLVDYRLVQQRLPDPTSTLVLYVEALSPRAADFSVWIHFQPVDGAKKVTRDRELRALPAALEIPLYVPAGEYDIRLGGWQPHTKATLCPDATGATCYLLLGTHRIGR